LAGTPVSIRAARATDAEVLSELALRSKAHWGYDAAFLEACRSELTVQPENIARDVVVVLESAGVPRGFYALCAQGDASEGLRRSAESRPAEASGQCAGRHDSAGAGGQAELELFYIDPQSIGAGFGRVLWRHMVDSAREHGYETVYIHSDPHAEGFYRAMGAQRVGVAASGSIEGRLLPLLRYDIKYPGASQHTHSDEIA